MKQKKYYLVAHWCNARGSSKENPAYYVGSGSSYFPKELENINPEFCYKSEQQVLKRCAKLCTRYWWASVVEVPQYALRKDVA